MLTYMSQFTIITETEDEIRYERCMIVDANVMSSDDFMKVIDGWRLIPASHFLRLTLNNGSGDVDANWSAIEINAILS